MPKRKRIVQLGAFASVLLTVMLMFVFLLPRTAQALYHSYLAFTVCVDTELTGAAQQENLLYCNTNQINGVVTDAAPSTYQQAIHLAQQKHVVVGYPMSVSQSVNWVGVAVTDVEFSRGYHAEHFNPSQGIASIYDPFDRLVYTGR